jgi:MFS family permease
MAIFVITPFAGPTLSPIIGGYVSVSGISWRWLFWILVIFSGVCYAVILFGIPETYA